MLLAEDNPLYQEGTLRTLATLKETLAHPGPPFEAWHVKRGCIRDASARTGVRC